MLQISIEDEIIKWINFQFVLVEIMNYLFFSFFDIVSESYLTIERGSLSLEKFLVDMSAKSTSLYFLVTRVFVWILFLTQSIDLLTIFKHIELFLILFVCFSQKIKAVIEAYSVAVVKSPEEMKKLEDLKRVFHCSWINFLKKLWW